MSLPLDLPGKPVRVGPNDSSTESDPAVSYASLRRERDEALDRAKDLEDKIVNLRENLLALRAQITGLVAEVKVEIERVTEEVEAELQAEYRTGWEQAAAAIAYDIRAELVCCDIYDKDAGTNRAGKTHAICFWGEAGARLAESMGEKDPDEVEGYKKDKTSRSHFVSGTVGGDQQQGRTRSTQSEPRGDLEDVERSRRGEADRLHHVQPDTGATGG